MNKPRKSVIEVQGAAIEVLSGQASDHISLTDIAKFKNPDHSDDVIRNRLRNRNTVEFLGVWERLNDPKFNPVEFEGTRTAFRPCLCNRGEFATISSGANAANPVEFDGIGKDHQPS